MTINLERELLKANRKLVTQSESLSIAEYSKHADLVNNEVLKRVGMNRNIVEGMQTKSRIENLFGQTKRFNQERVFHLSQIKAVCDKYYLRFLPTQRFKGSIDKDLPIKISTFELAHGLSLNERNSYIVAPASSFALEAKPKDPLLFYQINDEYFYLIHKWGNDLSITRALLSLLSKTWFTVMIVLIVGLAAIIGGAFISPILSVVAGTALFISMFFIAMETNFWGRCAFMKKNEWNSEYSE